MDSCLLITVAIDGQTAALSRVLLPVTSGYASGFLMISYLGPGAPYTILRRFGKVNYSATIGVVMSLVFAPSVKRLPVKVRARKQIVTFIVFAILVSCLIGGNNSRVADGVYKPTADGVLRFSNKAMC